jgi:hypothetical protein
MKLEKISAKLRKNIDYEQMFIIFVKKLCKYLIKMARLEKVL